MSTETDNSMMHITLSARGIETQGMIVSSSRQIRRVHAVPHTLTICNRKCIALATYGSSKAVHTGLITVGQSTRVPGSDYLSTSEVQRQLTTRAFEVVRTNMY